MAISSKTRKSLWARSGNRCAICKTELVFEKDEFNRTLIIGEECHIVSKSNQGPRHREIAHFDYDGTENLILLCCNHHTMIDEKVEEYLEDKLLSIKKDHEGWVTNNLKTSGDLPKVEEEPTKTSNLLSFITSKHDIEMNIKSSKQTFHSSEGLQIAFAEAAKIKELITNLVDGIKSSAPNYNVILKDNSHHICDVIFKGHTLLVQFYQAYGNSADNSYLLFAITDGTFDKNGNADMFYPVTLKHVIRLDFAYNDAGDFGWLEQEKKKDFYLSNEITEAWGEKFFKYVL